MQGCGGAQRRGGAARGMRICVHVEMSKNVCSTCVSHMLTYVCVCTSLVHCPCVISRKNVLPRAFLFPSVAAARVAHVTVKKQWGPDWPVRTQSFFTAIIAAQLKLIGIPANRHQAMDGCGVVHF